jgi:hypothetical protein
VFVIDSEASFDFIVQDDSDFAVPSRSQSLLSHSTIWSSAASSASTSLSITPLRGELFCRSVSIDFKLSLWFFNFLIYNLLFVIFLLFLCVSFFNLMLFLL